MSWRKHGLLFRPAGQGGWMNSHAQVPTVLVKEDRLRVYVASRPTHETSLTAYVDLDRNDLTRVLAVCPKPILELGGPGAFDEHGIMPASVVEADGAVFLYYSGWCRGVGTPYCNYTGLAISEDGGETFRRYAPGPVVDRSPREIYSATSPCVLRRDDAWHMWYCSGTAWHTIDGRPEHVYDIKYARSTDGLTWNRTGHSAIPQRDPFEAITRPSVIELEGRFHMWYCHRGSRDFRRGAGSYRIGHAVSSDLRTWQRHDDLVGLDVSPSGWDSEMVAYPEVTVVDDRVIMMYNGNGFGEGGFGWAELSGKEFG